MGKRNIGRPSKPRSLSFGLSRIRSRPCYHSGAAQQEAYIRYWHGTRVVAAGARFLAVGEVRFALQSSRSSGGLRCIAEVRFAGSMGHRSLVADRQADLVVEVQGEVPSIQFLSEVADHGFCGDGH
jgi:hypothetical protein